MKPFKQVDYVKKLTTSSPSESDSELSFKVITHRVYVRRIKRELAKAKRLIIRKCVEVNIEIKERRVRSKLNFGSEVNLISRKFVKNLHLSLSAIDSFDTRTVDESRLQTFGVHFLTINVLNKDDVPKYFEEFFLKISMQDDLILGMFWFYLAEPHVSWFNRIIEWPKNSSILPTINRVAVFDPEEFVEECINEKSAAYVLYIRQYLDNSENLKGVHSFRKAKIVAVIVNKIKKKEKKLKIPKKWAAYKNLFDSKKAYKLPKHGSTDHAIDLKNDKTLSHDPIYSLSKSELKILKEYIDKHLANDFIRYSKSPVDAPILFVKKKNGNLRLCVDYRDLNLLTIKNRYFLSLIEESLDRLSKIKIFTRFDITSAYYRIRIKKDDE